MEALNALQTRVNSEMAANHDRIESFKETTDISKSFSLGPSKKFKPASSPKPRSNRFHARTSFMASPFFLEKRWEDARTAYEKVLEINKKQYYAHQSFWQILKQEGMQQQAQAAFDKALQCLLESRDLELKPERGTQIMLNALAYPCLHDTDSAAAKPYRIAVSELLAKLKEMGLHAQALFFQQKASGEQRDVFERAV